MNIHLTLFLLLFVLFSGANATELYPVGDSAFWLSGDGNNITWQAISSANDPVDTGVAGELDFIGNSSDPSLFWNSSDTYLSFRFRVNTPTATASTFSGAHFVLIDIVGYDYGTGFTENEIHPNRPDYGFAWDSKSNDPNKHGLEMSVISTRDNVWNGINMDDLDGSSGQKLTVDINGGGRSTDGHIRTVDGQATTSFGDTTFIDYAVSWNYLETYTDLSKDQDWQVTMASIANATDHNNLNADIAGGATLLSSVDLGWVVVPEVSSGLLVLLAGSAGLFLSIVRRAVK